jgi:uncharacterized protein (UPF0335 family)
MSEAFNQETAERLRGFVERYERLAEDKQSVVDDQKAVVAEAKAAGFDPKILRACVKVRKSKPGEYQETKLLLDLYLSALGVADDPPLFRAANLLAADIFARDAIVEALKPYVIVEALKPCVPEHGSITVESGGVKIRLTRDEAGEVSAHELPAGDDAPDNVVRINP